MDDFIGYLMILLLILGMIIYTLIMFWQYLLILALVIIGLFLFFRFSEEIFQIIGAIFSGISLLLKKTADSIQVGFALLVWKLFYEGKPENQNWEIKTMKDKLTKINLEGLQQWNEAEITNQLTRIQDNPPVFRHYIETLKNRFVSNQNTKVAQSRIAFLEKRVQIMELINKGRDIEIDLALKQKKFENKSLGLDIEKQNLRLQFKDEAKEKQLQNLDYEYREKKTTLDIAKLEQEFEELKKPKNKPLSKDEINAQKRAELDEKLKRVEERIKAVKEDNSMSSDDKQGELNLLENKRFEYKRALIDLL